MTPLFPLGIIDQGWYLVIIFLIGLFFGLVLEQSGFSSSRKLAGVFYGYDFVVLKVFFTAGVTAMVGLIILGYLGIMDLSIIFVNSNFLISAIVGGVIMGFGFIMGGFCPGTSITGAVIGKIDAMVFIGGIFIGIFIFGAFDTTFNKLFSGYYFDRELLSETMGISKHLLALLMIIMALAAFGVAEYFEKRSTKGPAPTNIRYSRLGAEVFIAILIGGIILFLPQQKAKSIFENREKVVQTAILDEKRKMDADELAWLIINNPKVLNIIDVRDAESFSRFHLPGSVNIPLDQLLSRSNVTALKDSGLKSVLVSNGGVEASKALVLLSRRGYSHISVLEGGLNNFVQTIFFDNKPPEGLTALDEISKYRFREKASALFLSEDAPVMTLPGTGVKRAVPVAPERPSTGGC